MDGQMPSMMSSMNDSIAAAMITPPAGRQTQMVAERRFIAAPLSTKVTKAGGDAARSSGGPTPVVVAATNSVERLVRC